MRRIVRRRHRADYVLDLVFFLWIGYVVMSGRVLPPQVLALLHHEAPTAARVAPVEHQPASPQLIELAPET